MRLPTVTVASLGLLSPLDVLVLGEIVLPQSLTGTVLVGLMVFLVSALAVQWTAARPH